MKHKIKQAKKQFVHEYNSFLAKGFKTVIKPFSRFFREIFEFTSIHGAFGVLIFIIVLGMALFPTSISTVETAIETRYAKNQINFTAIVQTDRAIRLPLTKYVITQGFHFLHPAVDFATAKGSPVYPIMNGTVISTGYSPLGYGNHIIIQHKNGLTSLYAHLSKIEVQNGENVTTGAVVGLIGSTGWSTGPHLHLEIRQEGTALNPKAFFEAYYGQKLASKQ